MTNKAKQTQIKKYGGMAGYRREMSRRRGLVKNPGLGLARATKDELSKWGRLGGLTGGRGRPKRGTAKTTAPSP